MNITIFSPQMDTDITQIRADIFLTGYGINLHDPFNPSAPSARTFIPPASGMHIDGLSNHLAGSRNPVSG